MSPADALREGSGAQPEPPPLRMPGVGDSRILDELHRLALEQPRLDLLQFRSLPGAHQYRPLYRLCRRYLRSGASVLDWGAGNGHFSYFLLRAGYRARGFTIAEVACLDWVRDLGLEVVLGDPRDPVGIPLADGSVDGVVSVGVLEHVRETGGDEAASLREIARVLRPGGTFLCYHLPNRYSWIEALSGLVPGKHHHEFRFTRRDIEALLESAGLAPLEIGRYGFLPRNLGHRLPAALRGLAPLADAWDALDTALAFPFSAVCQNYHIVARKAGGGLSHVAG